jgi:hypothetical protein
MDMNAVYQTKDWIESSLLLAHNLRLLGMTRDGACYFRFEGRDRAMALIEAYWRGDLTVNARSFVDSQRRIKDLIHRGGTYGHGFGSTE